MPKEPTMSLADIDAAEFTVESEMDHLKNRKIELEEERVLIEEGKTCPDCDGECEIECDVCHDSGWDDAGECECGACEGMGTHQCGTCEGDGRVDW